MPSNFGMSDGNLVGIGSHKGSCLTKSFINLDKYGKFNVSKKGRLGHTGALKVPVWGLEGLAPEYPYIKVGFPLPPVSKWMDYFEMDSICKPQDCGWEVQYKRFEPSQSKLGFEKQEQVSLR